MSEQPSTRFLDIRDRSGCITKEAMRKLFEASIAQTAAFRENTPLGWITVNDHFSHYANPDTDTMWIGFALGMRCAERIAKSWAEAPAEPDGLAGSA